MTLVEDAEAQAEEADQPRRPWKRIWAALPWLVTVGVIVAAWLLGDVSEPRIAGYLATRAGPVSPALTELARVRFVSGPVTVFELT